MFFLQTADTDIVVTGKHLSQAHTACVQGGCTPLRDAQTSIAMAEVLFRDGNYLKAKLLLSAAIQRTKKHAADAPKPVAALYEAYATVSLHEGDQDEFRHGVAGQVRTLRNYVSADDPARIGAELALGDMWLQLRRYSQAAATYRGIIRQASATNQPSTGLAASMRLVWVTAAMGESTTAIRMLNELEQTPIGRQASYRPAFDVLRLRLAARGKNDAEVGAMISRISMVPSAAPILLFAPPYDLSSYQRESATEALRFGMSSPTIMNTNDVETLSWIDVGFYIRPDGTTGDIDILRSPRGQPAWAPIVLSQVARRRYSPIADKSSPGIYRVERVTKAASYQTPTGSLIRRRVADAGFQVLDLTAGSKPPN